ncbi:phosphonoacetaldehyde hydrolase [Verticiella sediminum]|uniref:Phosphonoacetaldehyde hydrolase n=1 Tax=Verticiella sediminum TaxID=1247510 RepID=A0A556B176_9BURK|nr:phosphonoacetaldehyde hydrolase [Verticiella sediminum]TSH98948.1 phosphonoacetaldehyde hydrolase [Verticiella sediminum]
MRYAAPVKIECAIFDWAGTTVDFGSFAPTQIFVEAFAEFGVEITLDEARGPMGMGKWDHIRTLCNDPGIAARFEATFGRPPSDDDVTRIYERFMPLQIEKIGEYSEMIPGALDVIAGLRERGIKIGSCSGYPKPVMDRVVEVARAKGYQADYVVATDEVPKGRPYPSQSLANAVALAVSDVAACVKVDDTTPGILEGRAAGMWTVALLMSGNALGLPYDDYAALPAERKAIERERIAGTFRDSRPHYLIDTIAELPEVIADIERRLKAGEMPQSN